MFSPCPGNTRHTSRPTKKVLEDDQVGYNDERVYDDKYSDCLKSNREKNDGYWIRHVLSSCRMLSKFFVRFSKWLQSVKKGVIDLFLCIAMVYNVFPCTKMIRNTQTEKIAVFTM